MKLRIECKLRMFVIQNVLIVIRSLEKIIVCRKQILATTAILHFTIKFNYHVFGLKWQLVHEDRLEYTNIWFFIIKCRFPKVEYSIRTVKPPIHRSLSLAGSFYETWRDLLDDRFRRKNKIFIWENFLNSRFIEDILFQSFYHWFDCWISFLCDAIKVKRIYERVCCLSI